MHDYAVRLCPTKQTPGKVHTAGGRATYREMCRHVHHICFLLGLPLQVLLKLLLSRNAHSNAVRLKIPHPLHTARVPTIELIHGASAAAVLASLRRDTTLPACSYAFIGKFRRWWCSSPPCCTGGGRRLMPTGLSLCLALDWSSSQPASSSRARPCSNILAHEAAPEPAFCVL